MISLSFDLSSVQFLPKYDEVDLSSLDIAVLHLFSSSGAQITVIKVQLAEGELSATVLMVCVGNDIWSGREVS